MNFDRIKQTLIELGEPNFRFEQILKGLPQLKDSWVNITTLPKNLDLGMSPFSWTNTQVFASVDGSSKAILTLTDHQLIETVLMPTSKGYSVCVSSEVGCAMNCAFCATGKLGFIRKLAPEEITDQVLYWLTLGYQVHSVVFMGMGEPFHNQESLFIAIKWLNEYYRIGYRHLSISTCGIPVGIEAIAKTYPQVNLAISLHAANDSLRNQLMPINKSINLMALSSAINQYLLLTNRQVMFEYLLIQELNGTQAAAQELVNWLNQFPKTLIHINLIGYNESGRGFKAPSQNRIHWFETYLKKHGISTTKRKSYGKDISGACGQLAANIL